MAKVRTWRFASPVSIVSITQATTVFLWTSNPAQRAKSTCILDFLSARLTTQGKSARGAKGIQVSSARSRVASWQQSALLDAPGSALVTHSRYQKASTSPRRFHSNYTPSASSSLRAFPTCGLAPHPFSSSSLRRSLIALGFTRNDGKAGGAGGRRALLPEREVPSHPFLFLCRRRRQNRHFGETKKPCIIPPI